MKFLLEDRRSTAVEDYYHTLGVSPDADAEQIHSAYRAAAKRYHPDRGSSNVEGGMFRAVQEAFEVLGNEARRRAYDDSRGENVPVHVYPGDRSDRLYRRRPPVWPTGVDPDENRLEVELYRLMQLRMRRFEELLRRFM